jgi:DNA-binding response OmpR family regulator
MLTAVDDEKARDKALGLYDEDYITKPVGIVTLKAKIENVLSRRR